MKIGANCSNYGRFMDDGMSQQASHQETERQDREMKLLESNRDAAAQQAYMLHVASENQYEQG